MTDIRTAVVTGTAPPQVRLDGSSGSVPLTGWLADPAPLYGLRCLVAVRPVPGTRRSELWLLGAAKGGPSQAVWGAQSAISITSTTRLPISGLGTGGLRHTVASNQVSVTDAGWYAIACEWKSDTVNSLVDREVGLFAGGTRVAFDRRAGIDGGYSDAGWVAGTLTAPAVYLPIGGLIYAEADGDNGEATTNITRLTITRTND